MKKPAHLGRALLATFLFTVSGLALAVEFNQFRAEQSTLRFVSRQMGVPIDGRFGKFAVVLSFDPVRPANASARLDLDLASVDAGSKDANDEVVGKAWFNLKVFPSATFASTAVRPLGGERFELVGKLTIKGKTQDITAPFTFRQEGANGVFDGAFTLKRLDFGVGDGPWSDVGTVANEVQIKFHIVAAAAAVRK